MAITVFNRYELKYMLSEAQYLNVREYLKKYMEEDSYGLHTICNIYYDTDNYDLISASIEKPEYKEKLRLRSYGVPGLDTNVFLEIKKKYKKNVNKRRIVLPLYGAYEYLESGVLPDVGADYSKAIILKEIDFFLKRYKTLAPRQYLAYDRIALFGKEDNDFRVTFDQNIRFRDHDLRLENGDKGTLILPPKTYLMEVKISSAMPMWFARMLSENGIFKVSFSKYGSVYKNYVAHCG